MSKYVFILALIDIIIYQYDHANTSQRLVKPTWEKSPFLGRLKLEKSTSENPEYMSMGTSGVVVVVLLFKWYCLKEREKLSLFNQYLSK